MNKKWEARLLEYCDVLDTKEGAYLREDNVRDFIEGKLAKQKTLLLARVREEVIGENEIDVPKFKYSFSSNNWRKEQLKKLEIISEEVK